jgi:hypothetical protein
MSKFTEGNKGRPKGSKNKTPNRENVVKLLDYIVRDFEENYKDLSTGQKIKLLQTFRHLYAGELLTDEEVDHFRAVTVNIIRSNGDND